MSSLPTNHDPPPPPPPPLPSSTSHSIILTTPDTLHQLISKRTTSWQYIQSAHSSSLYSSSLSATAQPDHPYRWFNTVQITRSQISNHLASSLGTGASSSSKLSQRTRTFIVLGMSLGNHLGPLSSSSSLQDKKGALEVIRTLCKVVEEWENWSEGGTAMMAGKGPVMGMGMGGVGMGVVCTSLSLSFSFSFPTSSSMVLTTISSSGSDKHTEELVVPCCSAPSCRSKINNLYDHLGERVY